jgi:multiple sugar transport system substrate-binding protein
MNLVYVPADQMTNKLIGTATNKQGPDTIMHSGDLDQLVPAKVLQDLSAKFDKWDQKDNFPDSALGKRGGKLYSIKSYANLIGLWYNQDILDEAGVTDLPKTFDELEAALKKIPSKYIGLGIAGAGNNTDADWQGRPFYSGFGFDYLKPEVAPLEECFTLLNDWRKAGYLPNDVATWTQVSSFPRFTAGQVAFCVNGNWQYGNAKADAKFKFGVVPMPQGPKGGTVYMGGEEFSIGEFTKDADLAWESLATSWWSKEGSLLNTTRGGSIPLRTDLAGSKALDDPIMKQFMLATKHGTSYPDPGLGSNVVAARQAMGTGWNAMMSGQQSPAAAAQSVVDQLKKLGV